MDRLSSLRTAIGVVVLFALGLTLLHALLFVDFIQWAHPNIAFRMADRVWHLLSVALVLAALWILLRCIASVRRVK